jgi:hypothetical protein
MVRLIAALFALVASVAAASAQGMLPSVWQSQGGAILKVLAADPATGDFSGVYLSTPTAPCPLVPYRVAGRFHVPWVRFQTSRTWTPDCAATAFWSGRLVSPDTLAVRWRSTSVGPDGRVVRRYGREIFRRL